MTDRLHAVQVSVVLSTFNGAQYLNEFLKSLQSQKGVQIRLIVRDDGSSDDTEKILTRFEHDFEMLTIPSGHMGVDASYTTLLEVAASYDAPFVAIADQDDLWEPEKLITAINDLKSSNQRLYSSARKLFTEDPQINILYPIEHDSGSLIKNFYQNYHAGCTMVLTSNFLRYIINQGFLIGTPQYDHTIYMIARILNTNTFDSNSYIFYRLHPQNDVGIRSTSRPFKRLLALKKYQAHVKYVIHLKIQENPNIDNVWIELQNCIGKPYKAVRLTLKLRMRNSLCENFLTQFLFFLAIK
jgi:rhamnosyltransferase